MSRRYWLVLLMLALLSPIGLLAEGTAWGEWDAERIKELVGFVPRGMNNSGGLLPAAFPDYGIAFLGGGMAGRAAGYIVSALIGGAIIYYVVSFGFRLLLDNKRACSRK